MTATSDAAAGMSEGLLPVNGIPTSPVNTECRGYWNSLTTILGINNYF